MMLRFAGSADDPEAERRRLDAQLGTASWRVPGSRPVAPREPGVPNWWVSDEEASSSFLRSMGVRL